MLISHEVPISLLEESRKFNDYDYCLLHLTYEYPEYKQYYVDAAKSGRHVLLDNSIFELGEALTNEQLAKGVLELTPTEYIVPDCLSNKDKTIEQFIAFEKEYLDLPAKRIGAVQGATVKDMDECYKFMSQHADKIAIPFDSKAFETLSTAPDILERWCVGRQLYIQHLVSTGLWNNDKPHHLLGCSYAKEFFNTLYKKISIESCDTSNPVVAGLHSLKYGVMGLNTKPSTKLCDLITYKPSNVQKKDIGHNVKTFREICNGWN